VVNFRADLSGGNVMLTRDSSTIPGCTAKITDFGLARSFQLQSRIQIHMYGTVRLPLPVMGWSMKKPGVLFSRFMCTSILSNKSRLVRMFPELCIPGLFATKWWTFLISQSDTVSSSPPFHSFIQRWVIEWLLCKVHTSPMCAFVTFCKPVPPFRFRTIWRGDDQVFESHALGFLLSKGYISYSLRIMLTGIACTPRDDRLWHF